uniref:Probable calcium-binding protein CML49 n=1 Tax=Tanacetum cinerariifolium TaxID=118510 RepID=A0A6L2JQG5_TANCI|nr:probable calcium-binding protein CML49 [Tanacetum cinerariifolium]
MSYNPSGYNYGAPPPSQPYYSAPYATPSPYGQPQQPAFTSPYGYGTSTFPPGTDSNVIASLSSYNQSFSIRTVRLLMHHFTNTNTRKIGPKEFTQVFYSLQNWRANFEKFDRDRSGQIDTWELREALMSLGFTVSPIVLDLLVSKFDKTGGYTKAIEYDNFIECCLIVKGLTEKFKEKDTMYSGNATFTYEAFMLTVLPFPIV